MSDISALTGLPEAPEGMFWRVKNDSWEAFDHIVGVYSVQLIRKVKFVYIPRRKWFRKDADHSEFKDEIVGQHVIGNKVTDVTPKNILKGARMVLENIRDVEESKKLLGDYPPLTLNQGEHR